LYLLLCLFAHYCDSLVKHQYIPDTAGVLA